MYRIENPEKLGLAVIINNVKSEYQGSERDTDALIKAYEMMKFDVKLYEDCTDAVMHNPMLFITGDGGLMGIY